LARIEQIDCGERIRILRRLHLLRRLLRPCGVQRSTPSRRLLLDLLLQRCQTLRLRPLPERVR
jgi:hypothetical protein